mmetsp:Transcript_10416/g.14369  ORF Transcript_10416/g.14369 Transcript_10416/m.14369 type:complete len:80 (-) Transcript_10416:470-709(-)
MRRSVAYEKQDKPVEAYEDIKKADELAPNTARIKARCVKLSVAAQERQEKMKNEMLGSDDLTCWKRTTDAKHGYIGAYV